jgi:hypothetical protein
MSALTTRCTNPKILLASPGASTHAPNHTVTQYVARTWVSKLPKRTAQWLNAAWISVFVPSSKAEHLMGKRTAPQRIVCERVQVSG